jgi:hypothetical protein
MAVVWQHLAKQWGVKNTKPRKQISANFTRKKNTFFEKIENNKIKKSTQENSSIVNYNQVISFNTFPFLQATFSLTLTKDFNSS